MQSKTKKAKMEDGSDNNKFCFSKCGNKYRVTPKVTLDLHERLPVGTYNVNYDEERRQYYLETINSFELKGKIYGDVVRSSSRIMNTFLDRHRSTGVLLVGEKGSGKTLLAQYISIAAAKEKGIPTIVVNKPWHGDQFHSFIQSISQPVVILMDEFEKVYKMSGGENYQEKILTLFDGVYASQKLFLLTCNDKYRLDSHMMNRPGRLYYVFEFNGLDQSFIQEYCEDNLIRKDYIPAVVAIAALFSAFNFDMLKAMVEDMNRYDESPSEVLKYLNIRPDSGGTESFNVKLIVGSCGEQKKVKDKRKVQKTWDGKPVSQVIRIYSSGDGTKKGRRERKHHSFSAKNLLKLNPKTRAFTFRNETGEVLILTPRPTVKFISTYDSILKPSVLNSNESLAGIDDSVSANEEEEYKEMMGDY
mmetsp:Transcript_42580/g.72634  ORF Transcript_42580/g.72634 Transcript_42580/m.72634 type:complete len:417 (-) Transcript_42580:86-1336(-)